MDTNVTNVRRVTYLVLDEADRMLVTSTHTLNMIIFSPLRLKHTFMTLFRMMVIGHGLRTVTLADSKTCET